MVSATNMALACVAVLLLLLLLYRRRQLGHWHRRGVYTVPPSLLLGNFGAAVLGFKPFAHVVKDVYSAIKRSGRKFGGVYELARPILVPIDPELIKDLSVKYFDSFMDRGSMLGDGVDELYSHSLLSLKGDAWYAMRRSLEPAFTGTRLKDVLPCIGDSARRLARFLATRPEREQAVDLNDIFRRVMADLIANTAFGSSSDAVHDPKSEFYRHGEYAVARGGLTGLLRSCFRFAPGLMGKLGVPFTPSKMAESLAHALDTALSFRGAENKGRADMLQLLWEAHKARESNSEEKESAESQDSTKRGNTELVSEAFTFYLAGYEPLSGVLGCCALQLALNPEAQDRLKAEVDAALHRAGDGKLSFEALQDLKFLDMVVSEILRMYPPVALLERVCTRDIDLPEYDLTLEEGARVGLPLYALHNDPTFFADPEKFDPDRFAEEHRHRVRPFTYLPFGAGPRNCIGMRYALAAVKLCLAYLVAACDLAPCANTTTPVQLATCGPRHGTMQLELRGGCWLSVTPRDFPSLHFEPTVSREE